MKLPKDREEAELSVIIPVFQEHDLQEKLSKLCTTLTNCEVIVVDTTATPTYVPPELRYFHRPQFKHRSQAMNYGAIQSSHENLWFLHVDCLPPHQSIEHIQSALKAYAWGYFKKSYTPATNPLKALSWILNATYLFTHRFVVGTNGLFIRKHFFIEVGMYPTVPLCEDLELVRQILNHPKSIDGVQLQSTLLVSSRKYHAFGGLKRMYINLIVYILYGLGIKPQTLFKIYKASS